MGTNTIIDLESLATQFGPLPPERVIYLLRQACESLQEAHAVGLVHHDIKPANMFLCRYGIRYDFIKVLDFGLVSLESRQEQNELKITFDGSAGGTPAYLAPELAAGKQTVDGRSDLYALGCVAFWLLTGHTPFERDTAVATALAHMNEPAPQPSQVSQTPIPQALEDLIMRCLEKDVEQWPSSAEELSRSLMQTMPDCAWTQDQAKIWWNENQIQQATQSNTKTEEAKITKALV